MKKEPNSEELSKVVLGFLILPGYLMCWQLSYYFVNGDNNLSMSIDYFKMAWTFSGGERPTFIWFFSIVMFILIFVVSKIVAKIVGRIGKQV